MTISDEKIDKIIVITDINVSETLFLQKYSKNNIHKQDGKLIVNFITLKPKRIQYKSTVKAN